HRGEPLRDRVGRLWPGCNAATGRNQRSEPLAPARRAHRYDGAAAANAEAPDHEERRLGRSSVTLNCLLDPLVPAKAETQGCGLRLWIPACAGMSGGPVDQVERNAH